MSLIYLKKNHRRLTDEMVTKSKIVRFLHKKESTATIKTRKKEFNTNRVTDFKQETS